MSRQVERAHSTWVASSASFSQAAVMLSTAPASRLPTAEWSVGHRPTAPPSWNTMTAEWGEVMRAACSMTFASISLSMPGRYSDFQ